MATSVIENEIVEATGFEPRKNYDRPDYLAALARHVNEASEEVFDGLSAEAQEWFNLAVKAINKKQDLPDFPDIQAEDESEETNEETSEEETSQVDGEGEGEGEEQTEEETPKKAAKPVKKAAKAKEGSTQDKKAVPEKKPKKGDAPVPGRKLSIPASGDVDRYGVTVDSKGHAAILILEKGARMSDVTESIGGTYYNLLQRLVKQGHKVEKESNGLLHLIHKHDIERKTKSRK